MVASALVAVAEVAPTPGAGAGGMSRKRYHDVLAGGRFVGSFTGRRIAEQRDMLDLPDWKYISDLEAILEQRGIPYRRWHDWHQGWFFEVGGAVVARGAAMGLLEQDVRRWLHQQNDA